MCDPADPTWGERLALQAADGYSPVSDAELVQAIRACLAAGEHERAKQLCSVLLERCQPMFLSHTRGLGWHQDLRDDAIANMQEHVLREVLDSRETFLAQNFPHYLVCACRDEFTSLLRQEGLVAVCAGRGRASHPAHIPRSLLCSLQPGEGDEERGIIRDVQDPADPYAWWQGQDEVRRLLAYLGDPLDRKIVVLRAILELQWDEIASLCGRTGRAVSLRYTRARAFLQQCILREAESGGVPRAPDLPALVLSGDSGAVAATASPGAPPQRESDRRRGRKRRGEYGNQGSTRALREAGQASLASVPLTRSEQCRKIAREKSARKRRAAYEALVALQRIGLPITLSAVARQAGVSIPFLKAHPDLLRAIREAALGGDGSIRALRGGVCRAGCLTSCSLCHGRL